MCLVRYTSETNIIDLWVSPFESRGLEKPCMLREARVSVREEEWVWREGGGVGVEGEGV